jgi:hypothetical protein
MYAAAASAAPLSTVIRVSPDTSYLNLNSGERTVALRQASTPVRIVVTGGTISPLHRIEVYAYVDSEEGMRASGESSALGIANLRIRNVQGDWVALEPLAEIAGRRGVRIAVFNGASASILLQVQLQVPTAQIPGTYQGTLILLAQEE